jgi:hypothetical protein
MLLKKSLRGVSNPLAKKSTSPIGLQTAHEHRLRIRRPLKTSREKSVSDFFNSIELERPLEEPSRAASSLGLFDACPCPRAWGRATARAGRH